MNTKKLCLSGILMVTMLWAAGTANANPILNTLNTGLGAEGSITTDYLLVNTPGCAGCPTVYVRTNQGPGLYPFPPGGPWMNQTAGDPSKWIQAGSSTDNTTVSNPGGDYIYRTLFTIPGPFSSAQISGQWAVDDEGKQIILNGVDKSAGNLNPAVGDYSTFFPFTINSGFVEGVNTLDFVITQGTLASPSQNPEGLRVVYSGTFQPQQGAVPEPSTLLLLAGGLLGAGGFRAVRRLWE